VRVAVLHAAHKTFLNSRAHKPNKKTKSRTFRTRKHLSSQTKQPLERQQAVGGQTNRLVRLVDTLPCARAAVLHAAHKTFSNSRAHLPNKKTNRELDGLDREASQQPGQTRRHPVVLRSVKAWRHFGCIENRLFK
jgi:hypothetical protein